MNLLQKALASLKDPQFKHNLNLVELLVFIFAGQDFLADALADKKIDYKDLAKGIPLVLTAGDAFTGLEQIKKEWMQSTDAEKQEVYEYFKDGFKLKNVSAEALIEEGLDLTVAIVKYAAKIKKVFPKSTEA